MATCIIAAVRKHTELRGNTYLAAIELAHAASDSGQATMSYTYLASKLHAHRRTAGRCIARLIEAGIITKTISKLRQAYNAWNQYRFVIPWKKNRPKSSPEHMGSDNSFFPVQDKVPSKLPYPQDREKKSSIAQEIKGHKLALSMLTPGSILYQASQAELQRLSGLLGD